MLFRELRLLLTSPRTWVALAVAAALAFLVSTSFALRFALCLALPFVIVVGGGASDHATTRALLQLGHRPIGLAFARTVAAVVVMFIVAAPAIALSWTNDPGALATLAIGVACVALAHVGIASACGALATSPSPSAATLGTLVVTAGAWAVDAARLPFAFAMPTSALRVFERGLVDGKDIATLVAGGVGLTIASAVLSSKTAPVEARAARCAAILVVTALACGGASQLRASTDLTRAQRASFPTQWVGQLAQVGDRIEVTLHARRNNPRVDLLEQRVLMPLRRYAKTRVKVRFDEQGTGRLATYRVGARDASNDSTEPDVVIPIILDLAGVR